MSTSTQVIPQRRKALASVRKGVLDSPMRVLVYGAEKVGKSTFAAGAPSPIFVGAESGTERLDVARLQPTTWAEAVEWVRELGTEKHDHQTLVLDPLNWLEPLAWNAVTGGTTTIESFDGGYGRGYSAAVDKWREMLFAIEQCWKRGMHIIITAHAQVKQFQNPEGPSFDRYEIAMNAKAAGIFKQYVDAVLFARLETFTKIDATTKKAKGYSSGARVLHTQPSAAYDAGSRWKLPEEIDLSWDSFVASVRDEGKRATELAEQITKLTADLGDPEVTKYSAAFVERNGKNADRLAELVNRLNAKLEEKRTSEGAKS
jgi:AAA domain